jgi:hypothetical protein
MKLFLNYFKGVIYNSKYSKSEYGGGGGSGYATVNATDVTWDGSNGGDGYAILVDYAHKTVSPTLAPTQTAAPTNQVCTQSSAKCIGLNQTGSMQLTMDWSPYCEAHIQQNGKEYALGLPPYIISNQPVGSISTWSLVVKTDNYQSSVVLCQYNDVMIVPWSG